MSNMFGFTKRLLESIPTPEKRTRYRDGKVKSAVSGLSLVATPSGKKTFVFRRKLNGKDVEVKLGDFPSLSVENARKKAREVAAQFDLGINPNEVKKEKRNANTFDDLFQAYTQDFDADIKAGRRRKNSLIANERLYRLHLQPVVGKTTISDFTAEKAKHLLTRIKSDKSYAIHNHSLTLLKSMFNRANLNNPFQQLKKVDDSGRSRQRYLNSDELERLLAAAKEEETIYQDIILMLLFTGARKMCVLSMEWSEINRDTNSWLIPTSKMKAKKPHTIPLAPEAMAILERRSLEAKPGQKYVFPSSSSKSGHISEKTAKGGFWRRVIERAGLHSSDRDRNVRVHDLRRTNASWQVQQGGSLQVTSKLLGHSDISITANTYAHLETTAVRNQLEKTVTAMTGTDSRLSAIKQQLKQLDQADKEEIIVYLQSEIGIHHVP